MKRQANFSHTDGVKPEVALVSRETVLKERRETDAIFDMVFAPDPKTGLPCSDISMYLSSKTPPQVRDFIQQNIMGEGLPQQKAPDGITDEDLHYLTRRGNETADEYAGRISQYMVSQKKQVDDTVIAARRAQAIKNLKK